MDKYDATRTEGWTLEQIADWATTAMGDGWEAGTVVKAFCKLNGDLKTLRLKS